MTYPRLTDRGQRGRAARQFHQARYSLVSINRRLQAPLDALEDPEVKARVLRSMWHTTRSHIAGMRKMLHALFD